MNIEQLRKGIVDFCRRQIEKKQLPHWWRDPILATAVADERFNILPGIAAPGHMLPRDLLPSCRTVVVFFIPFAPELTRGNIKGNFPSDDWGRSLSLTNDLIRDISEFIRVSLAKAGYTSELTPATYNFDPESLTARWSHKHLAHISGLGRFGINGQMITPSGCSGRLGSLVTETDLGEHPLVLNEDLCLHKAGQECLKCIRNCPVQAVTLNGILRQKCNQRLQVNRKKFAARPYMSEDMEVCAKCVAGMPCSLTSPVPVSAVLNDDLPKIPGAAASRPGFLS
ncbi:hypothetical protein [Desulfospira joergensenii]|uniref:hypothetical protein n=1 Tax=Desulfospira joergensenii TaxID=53329 RepID=UPI0003B46034|nr:hypothetical protein [Desulfospira joergensenii]